MKTTVSLLLLVTILLLGSGCKTDQRKNLRDSLIKHKS